MMAALAMLGVVLQAMLPAELPARGTVTLGWDQSADPAVIGYHLFWGSASFTYTNKIDAGTATELTVSNLTAGRYFFALTAYDAAGLESVPSNEVSWRVMTNSARPVIQVVTITPGMFWATNLAGPWVLTNGPPLVFTNPTGTALFKAAGVSITSTNL